MKVKEALYDIMNQPMDRREFFVRVGTLLLAIIGVNALIKTFSSQSTVENGYGSSSYGGKEEKTAIKHRFG